MKILSTQAVMALCAFLPITALMPVGAEGLRTAVSGVVILNADKPEGDTISFKYNEAVGIVFPAASMFIQGVEFELKIPKVAQDYESSLSWSIFSAVAPLPSRDILDYQGDRVVSQALPSRVSMIVQLPVMDHHALRSGPFVTVIPHIVHSAGFPVLFKLAPIGKGFGPSIEAAEFKLSIRPVLTDDGGVAINCTFPEGIAPVPYDVFLDDHRVENPTGPVTARKGARMLRIVAEGFREEIISVAVEAGKISKVSVNLVPNAPVLQFQAPSGAVITLDGVLVSPEHYEEMPVEPGEHTVVCNLGDYTMTRKFLAIRGTIYHVVLSVELTIQAEP